MGGVYTKLKSIEPTLIAVRKDVEVIARQPDPSRERDAYVSLSLGIVHLLDGLKQLEELDQQRCRS
jgi:hypothetical protein